MSTLSFSNLTNYNYAVTGSGTTYAAQLDRERILETAKRGLSGETDGVAADIYLMNELTDSSDPVNRRIGLEAKGQYDRMGGNHDQRWKGSLTNMIGLLEAQIQQDKKMNLQGASDLGSSAVGNTGGPTDWACWPKPWNSTQNGNHGDYGNNAECGPPANACNTGSYSNSAYQHGVQDGYSHGWQDGTRNSENRGHNRRPHRHHDVQGFQNYQGLYGTQNSLNITDLVNILNAMSRQQQAPFYGYWS